MLIEKFNLSGKTALITGSSQGIGKGIALAFAEQGADIVLHCRKDRDEAEEVAEEIKKFKVLDYCYEIYGKNKEGKKVEIYFNPVTAAVFKEEVD